MNCRPCNSLPRRQGGAAMVVALLVFGLCAALIVAMKSEFTLFYQRGANQFLAEQGYAYLRGAEELAALALVLDFDSDQGEPRDDLQELWAQPPPPYELDEGSMLGRLEDLQGRFNLNTLIPLPTAGDSGEGDGKVDGDGDDGGDDKVDGEEGAGVPSAGDGTAGLPRFTAAQVQFIRLLQALGEPAISQQEAEAITDAVGDWMDSDNVPRQNGAEDDYYYGLDPAYRASNRPMASASELLAVANVTPEIYAALLPWVTVWPADPKALLNIHTAPAMVLRSLNADDEMMPLSEAEVSALLDQRNEIGFVNKEEFLRQPMFQDRETQGLANLLGETSSWFLMSAEVKVAERTMHLYSVLQRDQRRVRSVARGTGRL